mmetsp:Transcript_55408/g.154378  ORF Transcript_55408/g.154378 Transcript_55408/m.154378 type:complete len:247 (-) Transcript_55408:1694-2434(-)
MTTRHNHQRRHQAREDDDTAFMGDARRRGLALAASTNCCRIAALEITALRREGYSERSARRSTWSASVLATRGVVRDQPVDKLWYLHRLACPGEVGGLQEACERVLYQPFHLRRDVEGRDRKGATHEVRGNVQWIDIRIFQGHVPKSLALPATEAERDVEANVGATAMIWRVHCRATKPFQAVFALPRMQEQLNLLEAASDVKVVLHSAVVHDCSVFPKAALRQLDSVDASEPYGLDELITVFGFV